jgi:undecaprenyl diphosphate synthase
MDNIVTFASKKHIKYLSMFAFSTENWQRPKMEVNFIMKLLANGISNKTLNDLNKNNIQFH